MILIKKLPIALLFLIVFTILISQLNTLLASYDFLLSFSVSTLINLIVISALIFLASLLFILFATIASDWRIVLVVGIISAAVPFVFAPYALSLIFAVEILISIVLIYLSLESSLKSYITFQPSSLLGPPIRHLSTLLILSFCIVFFLSTNKTVAQKGFQIPDSLIDSALKMSPVNLPAEQGPVAPLNLINDSLKQTVKDQIENFMKPYINFIPAILAVLLFLTLQALTSMINLLIYPLLWLIFFIFEKTGFVKFEIEQRTVRKIVV